MSKLISKIGDSFNAQGNVCICGAVLDNFDIKNTKVITVKMTNGETRLFDVLDYKTLTSVADFVNVFFLVNTTIEPSQFINGKIYV